MDAHDIYRHGQAMQMVMRLEQDIDGLASVYSTFAGLPKEQMDDLRRLHGEIEDVIQHQLLPMLDTLKKHIRSVLPGEQNPSSTLDHE